MGLGNGYVVRVFLFEAMQNKLLLFFSVYVNIYCTEYPKKGAKKGAEVIVNVPLFRLK